MGSSQRQWFPGCRSQAARPFAGAMPGWPGGVRRWEGRGRCALGGHGAQLGTARRPLPEPAETPGARSARCGAGSAPPAEHPTAPTQSTPRTPAMGGPKARRVNFSPRGCRDPTPRPTRPGEGQAPRQGERLPSPLPPLTLFGWTEGCLGESFSTLFHIHNGLNIGEQSGTWRAKPSPWSEPMTSPPR